MLKSIKEHKYNKGEVTLQNILGQSLWYARCSILSVSLMSGFGLPWNYNDAKFGQWFSTLDKKDIKGILPENMTILRAVYKKGDPSFVNPYNGNSRDFQNFIWDDSSFKKIITPSSQSYLIMGECMLAKYLYDCSQGDISQARDQDEKKVLSTLLVNSAVIQSEFMSNTLRNHDGLFVPKVDMSQNPYGDPDLEDPGTPPSISDQALAMEALSMASRTLKDPNYPLFIDEDKAAVTKKWAQEIYDMLRDSPEDVYWSKTKDLCNIISACIEYSMTDRGDRDLINYITSLSLELESRLDLSGNLMRFPDENDLTSSTSCFLAIKTMIQAYRATGIYKFLNAASLLYKKLSLLWDPSISLYSLDGEDKYKYTLRDIGSVIAGLNALRLFGEENIRGEAQVRFLEFFNTAVNESGLVQSSMPPPGIEDCEGYVRSTREGSISMEYRKFDCTHLPHYMDLSIAPVFGKKFTYKPKKRKFNINSKSFYSDYALFASREMLCTNYPAIDCYYEDIRKLYEESPCSGEKEDILQEEQNPLS